MADKSKELGIVDGDVKSSTVSPVVNDLQFALESLQLVDGTLSSVPTDDAEKDPTLGRPEVRKLAAQVAALLLQIERKVVRVVPEADFRKMEQLIPSPEAIYFLNVARRRIADESKKKQELVERTTAILSDIFNVKALGLPPSVFSANVMKISEFSRKYATSKGLDLNFVIDSFSSPESEFYLGVARPVLENAVKNENVTETINDPDVSVFRAGVLPSENFEQLMHAKGASMVMDIQKTWASRKTEQSKEQFLTDLMNAAKKYIGDTFGFNFLGSKLLNCRSISELQRFSAIVPVDAESYGLLKRAHLFLKVMHIILLHDSEVDSSSFIDNSENLRRDIDDFCVTLKNGRTYMNPPRDQNGQALREFTDDIYGMEVDRVEIAEGKPMASTIDKILRGELYDTTGIGDFARMRVFLTEEDCYDGGWESGTFNPVKAEKSIEKLMAIFIARFGNAIDKDSLDYSLITGKTNEASKGAHRGIHFNFKYKSACNSNGLTPEGDPETKTIDVEVQFLAYMPKREYDEDHESYARERKRVLYKRLGLDDTFESFVLDLISALYNDKYVFQFNSIADPFYRMENLDTEHRKHYERQLRMGDKVIFPDMVDLEVLLKENRVLFSGDKVRLLVLLLSILSKRTSSGGYMVNAEVIDYMNKYFPGKLRRLFDKYSKLLKLPPFTDGEPMAYLSRILQMKIRMILQVIGSGEKAEGNRRIADAFDARYTVRVSGVGKAASHKGSVKLTLNTYFSSDKRGRNPDCMSMQYDGPIGLARVPQDDSNNVVDFYWEMQSGEKVGPVYRIVAEEGDVVTCYLLSARNPKSESSSDMIPIWVFQRGFADERLGYSGKVYQYDHRLGFDPASGRSGLVHDSTLNLDSAKDITVTDISKFRPVMGLSGNRARFLNFVEDINGIWTKSHQKHAKGGEFSIRVSLS